MMIVTKEQQEALLNKYIKDKHNTDECIGFVDGINAALELMDKLFESHKQSQRLCECKQATFTRTVDEYFNIMCGRCGRAV